MNRYFKQIISVLIFSGLEFHVEGRVGRKCITISITVTSLLNLILATVTN